MPSPTTLSPKTKASASRPQTPPRSPPAPLSLSPDRYTQGELVTICVGPEGRRFNIYKDLLVEKSPYFAASLKQCWNTSNHIYLENDVDADAFGNFVNWMFQGSIPPVDLGCCEGLAAVTSFYKMANFLLVENLKNNIVDSVLNYLKVNHWAFNFYSASYMRSQDVENTMLYRIVMRSAIRFFMGRPGLFDSGADNDLDFLKDKPELMLEVLSGVRNYNIKAYGHVWEDSKCLYHEHEESTICL